MAASPASIGRSWQPAATSQHNVADTAAYKWLPLLLPGRTYLDGGRELPASSITRKELQALFDVIGTPHWSDVEAVQSPAWRKYLQRLPGQAPSLYRQACKPVLAEGHRVCLPSLLTMQCCQDRPPKAVCPHAGAFPFRSSIPHAAGPWWPCPVHPGTLTLRFLWP